MIRATSGRRGNFLLIVMALSVMAVTIAFVFVRVVQMQSQGAHESERALLSKTAARAGLDHAVESIVADYGQATQVVRTPTGTATVRAVTMLDGDWRARFYALVQTLVNPDSGNTDRNLAPPAYPAVADSSNDVLFGAFFVGPYIPYRVGDWTAGHKRFASNNGGPGVLYTDSRGRYYEVDYYNQTVDPVARATSDVRRPLAAPENDVRIADLVPVAATPFADPNTPVPERHDGLFLDQNFVRIPGTPDVARRLARYRLRYAVDIEDLSAHPLSNALADWDYRHPTMKDPGSAGSTALASWRDNYRTRFSPAAAAPDERWLRISSDGWYNLNCQESVGRAAALEHVFQGRGLSCNVDLADTASGSYPSSFPYMWRGSDVFRFLDRHYPWYEAAPSHPATTLVLPPFVPAASRDGGQAIGGSASNINGVATNALVGPQVSWTGETQAYHGLGREDHKDNDWAETIKTMWATPYGRGLSRPATYNPTTRRWYQGRVATPFYMNALTMPSETVSAMMNGYFYYRRVKFLNHRVIDYFANTGASTDGWWDYYNSTDEANQEVKFGPKTSGATIDEQVGLLNANRDFFIRENLAQVPFAAPTTAAGDATYPTDAAITPDWHRTDTRTEAEVYPGPGWAESATRWDDELGLHIDATTWGVSRDPYFGSGMTTYGTLPYHQHYQLKSAPNLPGDLLPGAATPPPDPWKTDLTNYLDYLADNSHTMPASTNLLQWARFTNTVETRSYIFAVVKAFTHAISAAQSNWMQYSLGHVPATVVPGGADPRRFQAVRDIDRQFLANLGENLDAPGTSAPGAVSALKCEMAWGASAVAVTPTNNIKSLLTAHLINAVTASDGNTYDENARARLMELVVNDFRMSFMGSSPEYTDGFSPLDGSWHAGDPAYEFRPLDLDGDGYACCSCYDLRAFGSQQVCAAPSAGGYGPTPADGRQFSFSGCIFIGKSHFYRIWSRGELVDMVTNRALGDADLEAVLCVDPEGNNPGKAEIVFQRFLYNRFNMALTRVRRW